MASQDDFLTTQKNLVNAFNSINTTVPKVNGQITSLTVTSPTVITSGSGRLALFTVVVAGSASGGIYNLNTTTISAPYQLVATPNTVGTYAAGQFFTNGLLVVPGTGQSINVTYSQ